MPHQTYRKFCSNKCQAELKSKTQSEINKNKLLNGQLHLRPAIKRTMLYMGIKHKCEICNLTDWLNKPISLILDHKNGNAGDDRLSNLRLICHNCDAQSEFYKGKNRGRGRKSLGLL
jgi:hypothetical protein